MQVKSILPTGLASLLCLPVVSSAQQAHSDARWELREVVRIGAIDGPHALASVRGVTVGRNGSVYIAEGMAQAVRIYTPDGRLIRTLGGPGSGPGEFRSVGRLSWIGDTLVVADPALQRFSRFDLDGDFIATFRASAPGASFSVGILHDGSAVVRPTSSTYAQDMDRPMPLLRAWYPDSVAADTIAWIRAYGSGACTGRRIVVCLGTDIGTADIVKVGSHGRYITIVSHLRAEGQQRQPFVVANISPSGDTLMKSNVWYTPIPVPQSYTDSLSGHWTAWLMDPPGGRPALTREEAAAVVRDGLQVPSFYAPVNDAVVAQNGDVWLEVRLSNGGKGWIVLDRRGQRKLDVVSTRSSVTLHAIDEMIWGVATDDMDVPYVVGFELRSR